MNIPPVLEPLHKWMVKYYSLGWKSIPVYMYYDTATKKKHPFFAPWKDVTTETTLEELEEKLVKFRTYDRDDHPQIKGKRIRANGLAILTGSVSGISVIDLDDVKIGLNWLGDHDCKIYDDVLTFDTPHGQHLIFKHDPQLDPFITTKARNFDLNVPIDIRANGGVIFAPPTFYTEPDGTVRRWSYTPVGKPKLHVFPPSLIQHTIAFKRKAAEVNKTGSDFCYMTLDELREVLSKILDTFPNRRPIYDDWLRICSAVFSSYGEAVIPILKELMPEEVPGEYEKKYKNRLTEYGMGTIIKMARDNNIILPERTVIEVIMGKTKDGTPIIKRVPKEKVFHQSNKKEGFNLSYSQIKKNHVPIENDDIIERIRSIKIPHIDNLCEEAEMLKPGDTYVFYAAPASGKSTFLMHNAHQWSQGKSFFFGEYTPKRPIRTIYIQSDRSQEKFESDYLPKLELSRDENILYIFTQDMFRIDEYDTLNFDLSTQETIDFVMRLVESFKPDCLVFDSLYICTPSIDFNKNSIVANFMQFWSMFANREKIIIWFVHHSNKMNDPKRKTPYLGADDYGGSRSLLGSASASFILNISVEKHHPAGTKIFSMGKPFTQPVRFCYYTKNEIINHEDKIVFYKIPETEPVMNITEYSKFKMNVYHIMKQNKYTMSCSDFKIACKVGTVLKLRTYQNYVDKMKNEGLLKTSGIAIHTVYNLTEKGENEANAVETMVIDDVVKVEVSDACRQANEPMVEIKYNKNKSVRAREIEASIDLDAEMEELDA